MSVIIQNSDAVSKKGWSVLAIAARFKHYMLVLCSWPALLDAYFPIKHNKPVITKILGVPKKGAILCLAVEKERSIR